MYRSIRFRAYGKRRHLALGPVKQRDAELKLRQMLADVERGTWKAPEAVEPQTAMPTFHHWFERCPGQ